MGAVALGGDKASVECPGRLPPGRKPRRSRIGVGVILFAALTILPLFRNRGVTSWKSIWAEDGSIFAQEAIRDGGMAVLLRSYQGYLQLGPRLLGAFTPLVPVRSLSVYLALSAAAASALLAVFVHAISNGWISSQPVRLALAALFVLGPALGLENTATITGTIWALTAVTPWALVSLEEGRFAVPMRAAVCFLATASAPVSALFLPLALAMALWRRTRATWLVGAAFAAGMVLQGLVCLIAHVSLNPPLGRSVVQLGELLSSRVFSIFLLGAPWATSAWNAHPEALLITAPLVAGTIFAVLLPLAGRRAQALAAVFLAYALITYVVPVWERGTAHAMLWGGTNPSGYLRYSVVPTLLLSSAAAVLLAPSGPGRHRPVARVGRLLFIAHAVVLMVVGFPITLLRSAPWPSTVEERYQAECVGASPDKIVTIPLLKAFFDVKLPCRHLAP
jgi:hypothetical protein